MLDSLQVDGVCGVTRHAVGGPWRQVEMYDEL